MESLDKPNILTNLKQFLLIFYVLSVGLNNYSAFKNDEIKSMHDQITKANQLGKFFKEQMMFHSIHQVTCRENYPSTRDKILDYIRSIGQNSTGQGENPYTFNVLTFGGRILTYKIEEKDEEEQVILIVKGDAKSPDIPRFINLSDISRFLSSKKYTINILLVHGNTIKVSEEEKRAIDSLYKSNDHRVPSTNEMLASYGSNIQEEISFWRHIGNDTYPMYGKVKKIGFSVLLFNKEEKEIIHKFSDVLERMKKQRLFTLSALLDQIEEPLKQTSSIHSPYDFKHVQIFQTEEERIIESSVNFQRQQIISEMRGGAGDIVNYQEIARETRQRLQIDTFKIYQEVPRIQASHLHPQHMIFQSYPLGTEWACSGRNLEQTWAI